MTLAAMAVLRDAVEKEVRKTSQQSLARSHPKLTVGQIRSIREGRASQSATIERLCDALGLEFYIGPPRALSLANAEPVPWWEPSRGLLGPACPVVLSRRLRAAVLVAMNIPIALETTTAPDPDCPHPVLCANGCRKMAAAARDMKETELNHGVFTTPVPMPEGETSTRISPHGCAWFGSGMLAALELDPERCKAVEIRDDAMAPTLPARSVALIDERRKELLEGKVYAIDTGGGIVMRRAMLSGSQWLAVPNCSPWEPIRWPETGEEAILGEAIWRAKYVPVGGPPGPNGLTDDPVPTPTDKPAYKVVDVDTSDASVEAVPFRGRLEPDQPRNFEMQIAAWFGAKFISELLDDPTESEVTVPVDYTMVPSLWPNSAVLVDRRRTELEDGAIYEIETSDGLTFRRAIEHGKEWALVADDPKIMPRLWTETDEVVGQAVWTGGLMPGVGASLHT